MKHIIQTIVLFLLLIPAYAAVGYNQYYRSGEIFRFLPGNYRQSRALSEKELVDPIQGPSAELLPPFVKRFKTRDLINSFVDNIETYYTNKGHTNEELIAWLAEHEDIRKAFWLAIDPIYDDAQKVIHIFDTIRKERPKLIEKQAHLAIALAVVHDQQQAMLSSRYFLIWDVVEEQWPEMPSMIELFDAYSSKSASRNLVLRPEKLVWPLLVHVVDNDLPMSERQDAIKRFSKQRGALNKVYSQVTYDYDKLDHRAKLGTQPYTLENLLNPAIGGVCVDQAHVCSRVMKTFGIPAMKMRGDGRYGGAGHAWTSFVSMKGGAQVLDTGRYNGDNYWTGIAFDPQLQTVISDRSMMMMLDGAARNYGSYVNARALTRMAASLFTSNPQASYELTEAALDASLYCEQAWRLLAEHYLAGNFDDKQLQKHTKRLSKLRSHPDATLAFINRILERYALTEMKQRMKVYEGALAVYTDRPDLQLELAGRMCKELFDAGQEGDAVNRAANLSMANASEGMLILPLVELVVNECNERDDRIRNKAFTYLDKLCEERFPKKRGNTIAQAYIDLRALVDQLK